MIIKKLLTFVSFILLSTPAFNQMVYEFEDPLQEKRFYSLISEIRCPKCTSGSIASSDVPVSRDIKNKVYKLILDGLANPHHMQNYKKTIRKIPLQILRH